MKFWTWLISWFRRKPDEMPEPKSGPPCPCGDECLKDEVGDGIFCRMFCQVTPFSIVAEPTVEAMELMKPIRTGKPQTYGEIERERSRVKHPRRH